MKPNIVKLCFFFLLFAQFHAFSAQDFSEEQEDDVSISDFPVEFLFGTATSAYQVEGAYNEDGKSLSNWDTFAHTPGTITNGDTGDVADDHYHRFLEDIELMHSLGVNSYRFSISWARILPRGRFGDVNPSGILFYNKVIDNLLLKGIEPFATILHLEVPQELEDKYGAWLSPEMQKDFVYFSEICFSSFGDRVKLWSTINEPNLFSDLAYLQGEYPPGHCSAPFGNCSTGNSDVEPLVAMHNMLLAHAKAVKLYREIYQRKQGGSIGIIATTPMFEPFRDDEYDHQAAKRALIFQIAWQLDPLVFGHYPQEMRYYLKNELPSFSPEEKDYLKGSVDFIGINHYTTSYAMDCIHSACPSGGNRAIRGFAYTTGERDGVPIGERTAQPWFFVVPRGLENAVNYVKNRYNNMPMYVTENGYAPVKQQNDQLQDILNDVKRVNFFKSYLSALARAIRNGANVRGYFIWSLMDNFEWTSGYGSRYGIYYVDRQTLERIPKLSAKWYASFLTNKSQDVIAMVTRSLHKNKTAISTKLTDEKAEM